MYKPISNYNNPEESPIEKSLLCNQVEKGEIVAGQLLCCPNDAYGKDGKCIPYSSDCLTDDKRVAKCHNLTEFDACRRTDVNAARVCSWRNALFCLSVRAPTNAPDYKRYPEAIKQIVSRSMLEESFNATNLPSNNVTFCDNGTSYQICNFGGNLRCGDLFKDEYNCVWWSGTDINSTLPRYPLGELCETIPTITKTVTTTNVSNNLLWERNGLAVGTAIGGFFAIGFCLILNKHFRGRWFC